jgi:hypothetical protein
MIMIGIDRLMHSALGNRPAPGWGGLWDGLTALNRPGSNSSAPAGGQPSIAIRDPFAATAGWGNPDLIHFAYGLMLARGFVTLLGAAGGVGKSALMTAIAICCALGRPLLGEDVAGKLRVLSINLEDSRSKLRRGLKAAVQHFKLNASDLNGWLYTAGIDDISRTLPGGLRLIVVDPHTRREIINETAITWLRHAVMSRMIDVLMIDPFSRLIRGNENAVDVVDQLMERLALIAVEAGIAILIAQHTRKAGGGIATDGVGALRGSSAVPDGARNAYGLTRPSVDEVVQMGAFGANNLIKMEHLKGNLSRLQGDAFYQLVGVRLPGGNPAKDPPQVERGRWAHTVEPFVPIPISQSITDPMRNAVMVVLDGKVRDKHGTLVPYGLPPSNGRSARSPIKAAGAALQGVDNGLPADHAERLAADVIKDLIAKGYVSAVDVKLPSYGKAGSKKAGKINGSNVGKGLFCHFEVTPWRQSATAAGVSQPAVAPPATASSTAIPSTSAGSAVRPPATAPSASPPPAATILITQPEGEPDDDDKALRARRPDA